MTDPVSDRVSAAMAASGTPVGTFVREFGFAASRASFDEWARHPVTVKVSEALAEMALRAPSFVPAQDASVQYGITLGLAMARQMMAAPETVLPGLFRTEEQIRPLAETFSVSPDDLIGG